ncbi:MAG TPA: hypothetical protein VFV67_26285 [Actinophytocola sp.]|uniref:hypothetical protein n=1 Tax=Actinophytocola sp. TaxID=1872138 RepID=UPI002DBAB7FB|nr:hypothetical protein [Actinophytocola sp.]HEU5474170.1 hypothetical protein [Actinophytocola sp.]
MFQSDNNGPDVVAGVFKWNECADVYVLQDCEHAHAYRLPTRATEDDVFAPAKVLWWYGACPVWTLRALLTLPGPEDPEAPADLEPAPPGAGVPGERMPVRMRKRGH